MTSVLNKTGTRVEHVPNSEYALISELHIITHDYGILL